MIYKIKNSITALVCAILVFFIFFFLFFSYSIKLEPIIWNFFSKIIPIVFSLPFFTIETYYLLYSATDLAISVLLAVYVFRAIHKNVVTRDSSYLVESKYWATGTGVRHFARTRQELFEQLSIKDDDAEKRVAINEIIDEEIKPIKKFLSTEKCHYNMLNINSPWGSGKTTSVFIAVSEIEQNESHRYIYESVFSYAKGLPEFNIDLLMTLRDTLFELGIDVGSTLRGLRNNFTVEPTKLLSFLIENLSSAKSDDFTLSSELIGKINGQYARRVSRNSTKAFVIFLIIDDLDRLTRAEDIISVISLLSVLQQLSFIRIIIPADLSKVLDVFEKTLSVDPTLFLRKYLPANASINVDFGYETAREAVLAKVSSILQQVSSDEGVYPVFAAILLKMLVERLREDTREYDSVRHYWPLRSANLGSVIDKNHIIARSLLIDAPFYFKKCVSGNFGSFPETNKYNWSGKHNSVRNFENIIYDIKFNSGDKLVCGSFSEEEYITLVDSWIFDYSKRHWNDYNLNIKQALDIVDSLDFTNCPKSAQGMFAYTFNQLFEKKKIKWVE